MATVTYFYIRVPAEDPDPQWRLKHADETVRIAGGSITCPHGEYLAQPDGTYEVRALSESNVHVVRSMLVDHEGLIIEREESHDGGIADLLVATNPSADS